MAAIPGLTVTARADDDKVADKVVGYLQNYILQAGDTIIAVCDGLKIDFYKNADYIAKINNIANYSYMMPGKSLWLPVEKTSSTTAHYTLLSHTLVFGETLYGLCIDYGIDFYSTYQMLAALNSNINNLIAGQTVILPVYVAATGTPATPAPGTTPAPGATPAPGTTPTPGATPAPGTTATPSTGDTVSFYLKQHVLQAGETMMGICAGYGLDFYAIYNDLLKYNPNTNFNYMLPGKVLLLPMTTVPASGSYYKIMSHKIVAGDTLYGLCITNNINYYGTIDLITALNANAYNLIVGQTILLPVQVNSPSATVKPSASPGATAAPGTTPAPATAAPTAGATASATATPAPAAGDTVAYYLKQHVLKAGETILGLCEENGINFDAMSAQIMKINNIASYNYMVAGTTLWLPVNTCPDSGPYYKVMNHKIVAGDTLYGLCVSNGIDYFGTLNLITTLNANAYNLIVGQNIYLPIYVK